MTSVPTSPRKGFETAGCTPKDLNTPTQADTQLQLSKATQMTATLGDARSATVLDFEIGLREAVGGLFPVIGNPFWGDPERIDAFGRALGPSIAGTPPQGQDTCEHSQGAGEWPPPPASARRGRWPAASPCEPSQG